MRNTILPRLLLIAAGVLLIVLTVMNPLLSTQSVKTLNTKDKTDAFVPGDVLTQAFTVSSVPESVDFRLETAASASGKIELKVTLTQGGAVLGSDTISLAKKKAKSWISLPVTAAAGGDFTLTIEVQGEGSVKLGGGASSQPAALNGETLDAGLDLQIKSSVTSRNEHLLLLGAVLVLLALIPVGGRRERHA